MTTRTSKRLRPRIPGAQDTSEAGIAADHVGARGQPRLQQLLLAGIALLALGGPGVGLSILLVNPTVCFVCSKGRQDAQTRYFLPSLWGLPQASQSPLQP